MITKMSRLYENHFSDNSSFAWCQLTKHIHFEALTMHATMHVAVIFFRKQRKKKEQTQSETGTPYLSQTHAKLDRNFQLPAQDPVTRPCHQSPDRKWRAPAPAGGKTFRNFLQSAKHRKRLPGVSLRSKNFAWCHRLAFKGFLFCFVCYRRSDGKVVDKKKIIYSDTMYTYLVIAPVAFRH